MISFLKTPNFYAEVVKLLSGPESPQLVVSERYCESTKGRYFHTRALRQFHRAADYVTVNSHHQRRALEDRHAWIRPKIATIYNGVDLNVFHPGPSTPRDDGHLTLLAVASITERKNGMRLIQALDIVREKYHIVPKILWIGEHQMHLAERRDTSWRWREEIKRLHLEKQWEWAEPRSDIQQVMRSCDALIHPSYLEGLPNVVCEAMASALPPLVSNTLDNPLMVQEGFSGFLFDPFSPESIADAMFRFSNLDAAARRRMGLAARSFAERELGLEKYVDQYEKLLLRMMTEHASIPKL